MRQNEDRTELALRRRMLDQHRNVGGIKMQVRVGGIYTWNPTPIDRFDSRTTRPLEPGEEVRVIDVPGHPQANTFGHCHIESLTGEFLGMCLTNSLVPRDKTEYSDDHRSSGEVGVETQLEGMASLSGSESDVEGDELSVDELVQALEGGDSRKGVEPTSSALCMLQGWPEMADQIVQIQTLAESDQDGQTWWVSSLDGTWSPAPVPLRFLTPLSPNEATELGMAPGTVASDMSRGEGDSDDESYATGDMLTDLLGYAGVIEPDWSPWGIDDGDVGPELLDPAARIVSGLKRRSGPLPCLDINASPRWFGLWRGSDRTPGAAPDSSESFADLAQLASPSDYPWRDRRILWYTSWCGVKVRGKEQIASPVLFMSDGMIIEDADVEGGLTFLPWTAFASHRMEVRPPQGPIITGPLFRFLDRAGSEVLSFVQMPMALSTYSFAFAEATLARALAAGAAASAGALNSAPLWIEEVVLGFLASAGHTGRVRGALLLDDGLALSWGADPTLRVWNLAEAECLMTLDGHEDSILGALLLPQGDVLSWSFDATLKVWDPRTGLCRHTMRGHEGAVTGALLLPDNCVLSWSGDDTLRVWDIAAGLCRQILAIGKGDVVDDALLIKGESIVTRGDFGLDVWHLPTGERSRSIHGDFGWFDGVSLLPNGHILSWGDRLRVWDAATGKCVRTIQAEADASAAGVLLLSEGQALSWDSQDNLSLWDLTSGERRKAVAGNKGRLIGLLRLPHGDVLSWSMDGVLRVWDVMAGVCLRTLEGHKGPVRGALVSRDGSVLSWSDDHTLRVWELRDGSQRACLGIEDRISNEP